MATSDLTRIRSNIQGLNILSTLRDVNNAVATHQLRLGTGRRINTADMEDEPGIAYEHFGGIREIPAAMRRLVNQTIPPARVDTMQGSIFWAVGAPLFEVPSANGNDPFALVRLMQVRLQFSKGERWGRYYEVTDPGSSVLDRINVRYLISNKPLELGPKYRRVATFPGQQVYENTQVQSRFYLEAPDRFPVRVVSYQPRSVILETECPSPSELVTSETHYPGWRATVDGREVPIHVTDGAFRGLRLTPGRHRIEMWFSPAILWRSLAVSAVAWALLAAAWIRFR